jgi:hypothetical protein
LTSDVVAVAGAVWAGLAAAALVGAADMAERPTPPAKIAPTRNATTAVSATVMTVKRRVMAY